MDLDSGADSVSSTPRSTSFNQSQPATSSSSSLIVRLMCSFGGKIVPRPHDNQLRYVGGDTRIVAVNRSVTYSSLITKLSKLLPPSSDAVTFSVKYQLPNEDLDSLITVSTDEDVDNMMDEYDRLNIFYNSKTTPRLRLFLFHTTNEEGSRSSSSIITELLDGSRKRESWFLDALNGNNNNNGGGPGLESVRSEVSSIVSEVPDYLFGLDNDDPTRIKSRVGLGDLDPGSPAFGSSSSAPAMPDLPPVKTKVDNPVEGNGSTGSGWNLDPDLKSGPGLGLGYPGGNNYIPASPVYYIPASPVHGLGPVPRSGPGPVHYVQQYGPGPVHGPGPVPVVYTGSGHVYGGGPVYEMPMQGNMGPSSGGPGQPGHPGQPIYYGAKNGGPGLVAAYPGMVRPVRPGDEPGPEQSGLNRV